MLASADEHMALIRADAVDFIQPDAPRVGGITPFLRICTHAEAKRMRGPAFRHGNPSALAAAYAHEPWVEHFDWLAPLFNEQLEIKDGRMIVPARTGLGCSLTGKARDWTVETCSFGV